VARAGVTVERVVGTAAEIADEEGVTAITMSAVAHRLGVSVPGLYKHVDGLQGVNRMLAVRSTNELADALSASVMGQSGDDALHSLCRAYRAYATKHPGRYAATVAAPAAADIEHQEAANKALAATLAMLSGYQLTDDEAIDATRYLRSVLHGFVTLELSGGFGLPQDVDASFARAVMATQHALQSWKLD
jgi:AcrR family transcriptional regulator